MAIINGTAATELFDLTGRYTWSGTAWVLASAADRTTNAADTVRAGDGSDVVFGFGGNDTLNGEAGDDRLIGGTGSDKLDGGTGADVFVYNAVSDSAATATGGFDAANADNITSFVSIADTTDVTQRDKIDFTGLAASIGQGLIWANTTPTAFGVWYSITGNRTLVRADTTGDGIADLVFRISTVETLSANDFIGLTIDTVAPTVTATAYGSNDNALAIGETITLTVTFSENVIVSGGTPSLALSSGGFATYSSGSGTNTLTFTYTVGAGQSAPDIDILSLNLNGAIIRDGAGNPANVSGAASNPTGTVVVDGFAPTVASTAYGANDGVLATGETITLTVTFSEAVLVAGGSPTLTLNSGGVASYTSGSGTNTLTFTYTVGAGQNAADLAISSLSLNGATVRDVAGNAANLAGAASNPAGLVVVDGSAPVVSATSYGSNDGTLKAGETVTLTVTFSEAVIVSGGAPSLALNSGGIATYVGGSGSNTLTFTYTVGAGQNATDLAITAFNLNGAAIGDAAGNAANLGGAVSNPGGVLLVDTQAPTITSPGAVNAAENQTGVATVTATDNNPAGLTYAITGGVDSGLFSINPTSGVLTFIAPPDFENPGDAGTNNVYDVQVTVTDAAGSTSTQSLAVTVTDVNENTVVNINSSGTASPINENSGASQAIYATTVDAGSGAVTYSLKPGSDAGLSINSATGVVSLSPNPNFEVKSSYQFTVVATSTTSSSFDEQAVSLTINNLDEVAPVITSGSTAPSINENTPGGQIVYTATATDFGDISGGVTWSLAPGSDPEIEIDSVTGQVLIEDSPNYEVQSLYAFTVVATDAAGNASQKAVTLAINDINENTAPTVTGLLFSGTGFTFTATDPDTTVPDTNLSYAAPFASGFGSVVDGGLTTFNAVQQSAVVAGLVRVQDGGTPSLGVDVTYLALGTAAGETLTASTAAIGSALYGFDGTDILNGGTQNDYLSGGLGADTINGGAGADTLFGGAGVDTLNGGTGADLFAFTAASDSAATATGGYTTTTSDQILSFTSIAETTVVAEQDKIDLSGLAASLGHTLTFTGSTPTAWGVWYAVNSTGSSTLVRIDTNGNAIADLVFRIGTPETLSSGDFILGPPASEGVAFTLPADSSVAPNRISTLSTAGAEVGITARAVDPTAGDTVTYSINDSRFAINANTGVITRSSLGTLNSQTEPNIVVTVTATSSDGSTAQQNFTIGVSNYLFRYAVLGDFGDIEASGEAAVASLIDSWNADFILSTGDQIYGNIGFDLSVGQHYADYIGNYTGAYGPGSDINRFFPVLGNHEYSDAGLPAYLSYFSLPDNERYYDFQVGSVHIYALNSNSQEPDGTSSTSVQAQWFNSLAAQSQADFDVAIWHHTTFQPTGYSGSTQPAIYMREWGWEAAGVDAAFMGHIHSWGRENRDDNADGRQMPYILSGVGGRDPVLGAHLVTVFDDGMLIEMYRQDGTLLDSYYVQKQAGSPNLSAGENDIMVGTSQADYLWGLRGNDTLEGKGGDDMLIGDAGNDTFIFSGSIGNDIVRDFAAGSTGGDLLDLRAFGIDSAAEFRAMAADNATGTLLTLSSGNTVQFIGISENAFNDADFLPII